MNLCTIKQGPNEEVEEYYGRLFKLANCFQQKVHDNFLTIIFRVRQKPYLHIVIGGM
jgi:hypothetical protein